MFYKYKKSVSLLYSLILTVLLIALDQFTKVLAVRHLMNKADIILIPNVLQLHYLENTGAAFSILEGKQIVFAIITPILLVALCYILVKMPQTKKYQALDYIIVFLIAGAIGNYIDRIMNNYVVDFIYFSLINFPVFNVADCYVTISVILLLILIMAKMYNLPRNLLLYIFVIFNLLHFSYARASLAMSVYFFGVSLLLLRKGGLRICGIIVLVSSYLCHRSMFPLIILTPLMFLKFQKWVVVMLMIALPLLGTLFTSGFFLTIVDLYLSDSSAISGFSETSTHYLSKDFDNQFNFKFLLINYLSIISIYTFFFYIIWTVYIKNKQIPNVLMRLLALVIFVTSFASIFTINVNGPFFLIGYRYLYMTAIPLTIIVTYMVNHNICSWKLLHILFIPSLLYSEGFIIGKIISLS